MLAKAHYKGRNGIRAVRRWFIPYCSSLLYRDRFRPVLCYLFTDWKCNIDCHYCWQYNNREPGMSLETAKSAIDWLKTVGCRVVALMGGEPLVRRDFILDVIRYGSERGFFMYLPTNGYLMDERFIDEAGRAGVAAINLAVDCVAPRPGLPKALLAVERQFRYLVERRTRWGFIVFFNINICRTNLRDVKLLTEIARQNGVGTDYHLNEAPQEVGDIAHFKHPEFELGITPNEYDEVEELLDWIIARQREGWCMVNSIAHLQAMKERMRGRIAPWECRAGHNGALIRPDGTLSPCFDLITYDHDWGRIWEPRFDAEELRKVRLSCLPACSSTCFYTMASYYNPRTVFHWIGKHTQMG